MSRKYDKHVWKDKITSIDGKTILEVGSDLNAANFNRIERGIENLLSLKADIQYSDVEVSMLKQNQMIYLIEQDILNKSTEMDVGYWFDSLKDNSKIESADYIYSYRVDNALQLLNNKEGNVVFKEHEIGFTTNKVTAYVTTKTERPSSYIEVPYEKVNINSVKVYPHDINIII